MLPLARTRTDYRVLRELGSGATATVYEVQDCSTGVHYALKQMRFTSRHEGGDAGERFAEEVLLLARISSPHVVRLVAFGFDKGQPFVVLELLSGEPLSTVLKRERAPRVDLARSRISDALFAVRDCHAAGVVHRDIKPANLLVTPDGHLKVVDFGVARFLARAHDDKSANEVVGSVSYMAPEQLSEPLKTAAPADIYAVGVTAFQCMSGALPFDASTTEAMIAQKLKQRPKRLSDISGALHIYAFDAFFDRTLERYPEGRFPSAAAMLKAWNALPWDQIEPPTQGS